MQDAKEKILLAARSLFAEQGFEGTTVRQICERAGVNQALVSYYFGGKESLYIALFEHFVTIPKDFDNHAGTEDPISLLTRIVEQIFHWRFHNPEIIHIVQREMMSKTMRLSGVLNRVVPLWQVVRQVLNVGREQGLFQFQSLDYSLLLVMGSLMYPYSYPPLHNVLKTEKDNSEKHVCEQTLQFILRGLGYTEN